MKCNQYSITGISGGGGGVQMDVGGGNNRKEPKIFFPLEVFPLKMENKITFLMTAFDGNRIIQKLLALHPFKVFSHLPSTNTT